MKDGKLPLGSGRQLKSREESCGARSRREGGQPEGVCDSYGQDGHYGETGRKSESGYFRKKERAREGPQVR